MAFTGPVMTAPVARPIVVTATARPVVVTARPARKAVIYMSATASTGPVIVTAA